MTEQHPDIASVADRARPVRSDATMTAVHFLGDTAAFVLGEESVLLVDSDDQRRTAVHGGAILAAAADGERVMTGGDDGKVAVTDRTGAVTAIAVDAKRRWIDRVAIGPGGTLAWSAGREATVRAPKAGDRVLEAPSTVGALAFAPKGVRLAIAHYNGVTLWFPNAPEAKPDLLEWKGSHLAATFSPDGRFLVTAMQEPTLHGWRLADRKDMRMQGYTIRVRSLDWTADGKWLASSGASQLILWPFQSRDGPMGKTPQTLAPAQPQVTAVACHPREGVIAVGYADGVVLLIRREDGAEILAHRPAGAGVSALAWNRTGTRMAFGCEDGEGGVLDLR